jgi:hypothetical protein
VRSLSVLAALSMVVLVAACGNARPCTSCPKMEGNWVFGYSVKPVEGDCANVAVYTPPGTMTFTQYGASIYTTAGGNEINGTLYDDNQFILRGQVFSGDGGSLSLYWRGEFIAGSSTLPDGGSNPNDAQLSGTFTASVRGSTAECRMPADFTAVR